MHYSLKYSSQGHSVLSPSCCVHCRAFAGSLTAPVCCAEQTFTACQTPVDVCAAGHWQLVWLPSLCWLAQHAQMTSKAWPPRACPTPGSWSTLTWGVSRRWGDSCMFKHSNTGLSQRA